jgi:predicted metal-dependent hydrolase
MNPVIIRQKRKTLAIHLLSSGEIIVKAPIKISDLEIENFIKRKHSWIDKHLNYFKQFKKIKFCDYSSGSQIFYMGQEYKIIVEKTQEIREYVVLNEDKLIIFSMFPSQTKRTKNIFKNWIGVEREKEFRRSLERCIEKFPNVPMPQLKIRKLRRRWGSFSNTNIMTLNQNLIATSKNCIDYVVCHELCHFYHKNHSSKFYDLLEIKLPNWKELKRELELSNNYASIIS